MRIFIVDDCEILRMSLDIMFRAENGVEVVGVSDSRDAELIQRITGSRCNTLLVGLRLGRACGLDLVRKLRQTNSAVCVVMLGYSTDLGNISHMHDAGADDFVSIASSNAEIVTKVLQANRNGHITDFSVTTSYDRLPLSPS
jgi:DNA-binding NarL/FixJ family response regulator